MITNLILQREEQLSLACGGGFWYIMLRKFWWSLAPSHANIIVQHMCRLLLSGFGGESELLSWLDGAQLGRSMLCKMEYVDRSIDRE